MRAPFFFYYYMISDTVRLSKAKGTNIGSQNTLKNPSRNVIFVLVTLRFCALLSGSSLLSLSITSTLAHQSDSTSVDTRS